MSISASHRLLDPVERTSEVLFGLIMVLTFTGSISVYEAGEKEMRAVLVAAVACNLAWGLVDAVMYLMASFMGRARDVATLRAVRTARDGETARGLILDALPEVIAGVLEQGDVETLRQRLSLRSDPAAARLGGQDFVAAGGVFLLVFLSTFPVVIPFLVMSGPVAALRISNAIAIAMLFALGWALGTYAGRSGWRAGLGMVAIGVALVAVTIALGG